MTQMNNKSLTWIVVIGILAILCAVWYGFSQVPTAQDVADDLNIPTEAALTAAINSAISTAVAGIDVPTVDTEKVDRVCDLTEGCDGQWDLNNFMRNMAVGVVMDELTDRQNKELYSGIKDIVDIEEREDINSVDVSDDNGEMTVNQEDYDSLYDANDDTVVTVEFVVEVDYFDDEDNEDRTRWFKVTATVSDVEDGIADGDVVITSVERVSEHFEFDE